MHRAQPSRADLSEHRTVGPSPAVDCTQHTQVVLHLMLADRALFDDTSEGSLSLTVSPLTYLPRSHMIASRDLSRDLGEGPRTPQRDNVLLPE
eukprot:2361260-Rhodomonas_salina.3